MSEDKECRCGGGFADAIALILFWMMATVFCVGACAADPEGTGIEHDMEEGSAFVFAWVYEAAVGMKGYAREQSERIQREHDALDR